MSSPPVGEVVPIPTLPVLVILKVAGDAGAIAKGTVPAVASNITKLSSVIPEFPTLYVRASFSKINSALPSVLSVSILIKA